LIEYLHSTPCFQPAQLRDATPDSRAFFTRHIYAGELLGCHLGPYDLESLAAFREGLRTVLFPTLPPLINVCCLTLCLAMTVTDKTASQTMGTPAKAKELLVSICGRRVDNPEQVISLLDYGTVDASLAHASSDTVLNAEDRARFAHHLQRYLRGKGHPVHKNWGLDHIDQESRDVVAQDSVMRCKRLLALTTGSELLPSNTRQRIGVSLSSVLIVYSTLTLLFQGPIHPSTPR
jgi:hypothetical protein